MKHHTVVFVVAMVFVLAALSACGGPPAPTPGSFPTIMELGINSISDPIEGTGSTDDATNVRATRDRWVVEWFWIEQPWREDDPAWGLGKGEFGWQG